MWKESTYTLLKVKRDSKEIKDDETFSVTCLATSGHFAPFLADESRVFTEEARNAGVTAFCAKPMFMSDLRETFMTAIGQHETESRDILLQTNDTLDYRREHRK
ncbi:MAG: hypothetical protein PUB00_06115 [Clostridiales bacterium]|nr:hypothetical protein [Clostridiales bacterium]